MRPRTSSRGSASDLVTGRSDGRDSHGSRPRRKRRVRSHSWRPGKGASALPDFPALLTDAALINRRDLSLAEQHAIHEQMPLADAVVALGLVREEDSYAKLAEAGGFEVADLEHAVSSELAVRLVPERIARRYFVVPLMVDNRTLTYATSQPFNAQAATRRRVRVREADANRRGDAVGRTQHPRPLLPEAARARRPRHPAALEGTRSSKASTRAMAPSRTPWSWTCATT